MSKAVVIIDDGIVHSVVVDNKFCDVLVLYSVDSKVDAPVRSYDGSEFRMQMFEGNNSVDETFVRQTFYAYSPKMEDLFFLLRECKDVLTDLLTPKRILEPDNTKEVMVKRIEEALKFDPNGKATDSHK